MRDPCAGRAQNLQHDGDAAGREAVTQSVKLKHGVAAMTFALWTFRCARLDAESRAPAAAPAVFFVWSKICCFFV
jgi:hypothetical protein